MCPAELRRELLRQQQVALDSLRADWGKDKEAWATEMDQLTSQKENEVELCICLYPHSMSMAQRGM